MGGDDPVTLTIGCVHDAVATAGIGPLAAEPALAGLLRVPVWGAGAVRDGNDHQHGRDRRGGGGGREAAQQPEVEPAQPDAPARRLFRDRWRRGEVDGVRHARSRQLAERLDARRELRECRRARRARLQM